MTGRLFEKRKLVSFSPPAPWAAFPNSEIRRAVAATAAKSLDFDPFSALVFVRLSVHCATASEDSHTLLRWRQRLALFGRHQPERVF